MFAANNKLQLVLFAELRISHVDFLDDTVGVFDDNLLTFCIGYFYYVLFIAIGHLHNVTLT